MTVESGQGAALRCANHPDVETHLRCSRCGKPICVRCVVPTPVGGRCRECANVRKSPVFIVGPGRYARAAAYGLGMAAVGGYVWASLGRIPFSIILLLLLGYLVGEAVSRGADGRISRGLSVMAGAFTVAAVVIGRGALVFSNLPAQLPLDARLIAAANVGIGSILGNLFQLIFLVLAVVIAVRRVS